jgi:energy-coupling factor transporter transmembrane protein EcfT
MAFSIVLIIILAVIAALVLCIVFKVAKIFMKIAFAAAAVLIIAVVVSGFFVFQDYKDFRENVNNSVYIVAEKNNALAGFYQGEAGELSLMGTDELAAAGKHLAAKNFSGIRGSKYKLFLFNSGSIKAANSSFEILGRTFNSEDALKVINSSGSEALAPYMGNEAVASFSSDSGKVRSLFFGQLMASSAQKNPMFLAAEISNGGLKVYPETALFKMLKIVPISMAKKFISEGLKNATEEISAKVKK